MTKIITSLLLFLFTFSVAKSQISRKEYIQRYSKIAVQEMHRTQIPASITLAQALLESSNGNSSLAIKANNHFGIKCHSSWTGKKVYKDDDAKDECFRKYTTVLESYKDHSDFIKNGRRYAFLFDIKNKNYKDWAKGLKKAGYATNPKYPAMLIKIIEDNNLVIYDKGKKYHKKEQLADVDSEIKISTEQYKINTNNRIKYVKAKAGDSVKKIAKALNMNEWQIYKYNDFNKNHKLIKGEIIYTQPKRLKAEKQFTYHTIKKEETLHYISQKYGIKLKKLLLYNNLKEDSKINHGHKLKLRK